MTAITIVWVAARRVTPSGYAFTLRFFLCFIFVIAVAIEDSADTTFWTIASCFGCGFNFIFFRLSAHERLIGYEFRLVAISSSQ